MTRRAVGIIRRITILFLVILAAFLLSPATSLACSGPTEPPNYKPPTIAERVKAASFVFDGVILERPSSIGPETVLTMQVYKYFKGSGPSVVKIKGFGSGVSCREEAPFSESIFFTWGDSANTLQVGGLWEFSYLPGPVFGYKFAEFYSDNLANQVIAATANQPSLPVDVTVAPTPTLAVANTSAITPPVTLTPTTGVNPTTHSSVTTSSTQPQDTSSGWLVPVGGGLGVLMLGFGGLFLLRKRRNL